MKWETPEPSILDHPKILSFFAKRPWLIKAVCYLGIAFFALDFLPAVSTYFWPSTIGTVISSSVGNYDCIGDLSGATCYLPLIEYRYKVNGKEYFSSKYNFQGNLFNSALDSGVFGPSAQQIIGRYKPGQNLIVVYNPFHPAQAILHRGYVWKHIPFTVFLLSVLALITRRFWPEKFKPKQNSLDEFPEI